MNDADKASESQRLKIVIVVEIYPGVSSKHLSKKPETIFLRGVEGIKWPSSEIQVSSDILGPAGGKKVSRFSLANAFFTKETSFSKFTVNNK